MNCEPKSRQYRSGLNRRNFLRAVGLASISAPAFSFAGEPANDRISVALVGAGNAGQLFLKAAKGVPGHRFVAVCDVDRRRFEATHALVPEAERYSDYRQMFDSLGASIDAVVVATPSHSNGVVAMRAMRMGKHVYLEAPVSNWLTEVPWLGRLGSEKGVTLQVGHVLRSHPALPELRQQVESLGVVTLASVDYVPFFPRLSSPVGQSVPEQLNWDLWLGPAPLRPYRSDLTQSQWRYFWDFGGGHVAEGVDFLDLIHCLVPIQNKEIAIQCGGGNIVGAAIETPDTQAAAFRAGNRSILWSHRTWRLRKSGEALFEIRLWGTNGEITLTDRDLTLNGEKRTQNFARSQSVHTAHIANFFDSARSGKAPRASIAACAPATMMAHGANAAVRIASADRPTPTVRLNLTTARFQEKEANALVTPSYRQGFEPA